MDRETYKRILKKLRKYEIFIKKVLTTQRQGDLHSIFKGSGITFDDVRQYQYGDDIRTIDWNASAKGHGVFVKTFREEREQQVYLLMDVSASQEIGTQGHQKLDLAREVSGVLSLSAIEEGSKVGLLCFSDRKEKYLKADKGAAHIYKIFKNLYDLNPSSRKTDLKSAMAYLLNLLNRRSLIFIVSDFIDENFWHNLKALGRKHDCIVLHVNDPRESNLPSLGIIPVIDKESGKTIWLNTASNAFKNTLKKVYHDNREILESFCHKHQISYLNLSTHDDYVPKLINLFKKRNLSSVKS